MRVMFVVMPLASHLYPSVPLAWAMQNAGHEVRVACDESIHPQVSATGLTAVSLGAERDYFTPGLISDEMIDRITDALAFDGMDARVWRAIRHYVFAAFGRYYAEDPQGAGYQSIADNMVRFAEHWRPDLIICDPAAWPATIAARRSGAVAARLLWGQDYFGWIRTRLRERVGEPGISLTHDPLIEALQPMFRRFGYEYDDGLLFGDFSIDPLPAAMRLPIDLPYVPMRWIPYNGSAPAPAWLHREVSRPRICLSLGVTTHRLFSNVDVPISAALEMVADLDVELVATLSPDQARAVPTFPDNVRIIEYLPLNQLLPTCSAIVHHGGFGTFAAAAAHRVPQMVLLEEGGDALATTRYLEDRGAGITLQAEHFTVADMRKQIVRLLEEPSFRTGAEAAYADSLAAPSPNDLVPILERLTAAHRR